MMKRWWIVLIMGTGPLGACGAGCPEPSVFPVPPTHVMEPKGERSDNLVLARREWPLPLSAESAEQAKSFLVSCAEDGSSECNTPVPDGQACALKAFRGANGFETAASCPGARRVLAYDARQANPTDALLIADWLFAVQAVAGEATADSATQQLLIFHATFPQPVY